MKSMSQFQASLDRIDSLKISPYEKDVIRSAYYNYLNQIPLPENAKLLLRTNRIRFRDGGIHIDVSHEREERKKLYREGLYKRREARSTSSELAQGESTQGQTSGIYTKNFLQASTKSKALTALLENAATLHANTEQLLHNCESLMRVCFQDGELSLSMTSNIVAKIRTSAKASASTLEEFVQPFLELFDGLQPQAQQEILQKSNEIMAKITQAKDTAAALCIKLSTIRAHHAMPKENDFIAYLEHTIQQFDNYVR